MSFWSQPRLRLSFYKDCEAPPLLCRPQRANATPEGRRAPSATRRRASARVSRGPWGASVRAACRATGASPSAGRVTATATATTATLRPASARAAGTSPPDTTARGRGARQGTLDLQRNSIDSPPPPPPGVWMVTTAIQSWVRAATVAPACVLKARRVDATSPTAVMSWLSSWCVCAVLATKVDTHTHSSMDSAFA